LDKLEPNSTKILNMPNGVFAGAFCLTAHGYRIGNARAKARGSNKNFTMTGKYRCVGERKCGP